MVVKEYFETNDEVLILPRDVDLEAVYFIFDFLVIPFGKSVHDDHVESASSLRDGV